jgi:ketosteroid isomerase-like protein
MDRQRVDAWLDGYRRAWEQADTPAVLGLFTTDASYRSHPLRPAHTGHGGVAAYWARATADQQDVRVRFGDPIVDGDRGAVEWWARMRAGGDPGTLAGCLLLTFAADGRCRELRECWHMAEEILDPPADWGRLAGPPRSGAGDQARQHARRWADGYERAWRAADPEAAAALYAPDAHFRSAPFRDPDLGRDGVLAYTRAAYATEADQDPRFGTPVAAGSAAAVEWWTTTLEDGQPSTLIGTSFLTFTSDGLIATARDYWFLEPGTHPPFDGWGR